MADILYTIECDALPSDAHVVAFTGREALSEPYVFEIGIQTSDEQFDPAASIRAKAKLLWNLGPDAKPYFVHGILREVELVHQHQGRSLYRLTLVPRLWNLTQTFHSRIFTDLSVPDIIAKILKNCGLQKGTDFEIKTMATYAKVEHVTQYKESHFDFISRWMEREGLYYFFEQTDDCEKLVVTDSITLHGGLTSGTVRYVPTGNDDFMALEHFSYFSARHRARPADVLLRDYDYLKPTLDLQSCHVVDARGDGQIHIFGDNLVNPGEAKRYAAVRAEEIACDQVTFAAEGRAFQLRPNFRFSLDGHPNALYDGESYLVTELRHAGNQSARDANTLKRLALPDLGSEEYAVRLTAIRDDVQYRAPRRALWPRIDGYELADICGSASSDYAQVDDHGRYKCRAYFDEGTMADGSASTWIRMMQPHGGGNEGFHFPLRKGTEVALFFLHGDPDRPVIAGVVPNALKQSPVHKGNSSKNVIQTGGRSLIEIEDQAGSECVHISTPHSGTFIRMGAPRGGASPAGGASGAVRGPRSAAAGASGGAGAAASAAEPAPASTSATARSSEPALRGASEPPPSGPELARRGERLGLVAAVGMLFNDSVRGKALGEGEPPVATALPAALDLLGIPRGALLAAAAQHGCTAVLRALGARGTDVMVRLPSETPADGAAGQGASGAAPRTSTSHAEPLPAVIAVASGMHSASSSDASLGTALTTERALVVVPAAASTALELGPAPQGAPTPTVPELLEDLARLVPLLAREIAVGGAAAAAWHDDTLDKARILVEALELRSYHPDALGELGGSGSDPWAAENVVGPAHHARGFGASAGPLGPGASVWPAPLGATGGADPHGGHGATPPAGDGHGATPPAAGGHDGGGTAHPGAGGAPAAPGVQIQTGGDRHDEHGNNRIITNHDHNELIKGNEDIEVEGTFKKHVHGLETLDLDSGVVETVGAFFRKTVNGPETLHITGHVTETIDSGETKTVTGGVSESILGYENKLVTGAETHINAGLYTHIVGGAEAVVTAGLETHLVGAAGLHFHAGPHKDLSPVNHLEGGSVHVKALSSVGIHAGAGVDIHAAGVVDVHGSGMVEIKGDGSVEVKGGRAEIHCPTVTVHGATTFNKSVGVDGVVIVRDDAQFKGCFKCIGSVDLG
ncbi:MAG: type VI secretion system tip protein VgrG [Polyangiaceae bacterium]|nr:type VI secretion system tip protein VgrG [Polyangiaceae bacterium]